MNVRLYYETAFLAGVYFDDRLQMNSYNVGINLITRTADSANSNIALERVKTFVDGLNSTVFINSCWPDHEEIMSQMGIDVTALPEEPVDQIVGMMLYYKLNAVMEGRMEITQLELSSSLGDGVCYLHDEEDPVGPFHQPGWWYDPTAIRTKNTPTDTTINIVKIKHKNWREFGLDWPDAESKEVANTVVYANFTKNEN
jgi:hypothetical protein